MRTGLAYVLVRALAIAGSHIRVLGLRCCRPLRLHLRLSLSFFIGPASAFAFAGAPTFAVAVAVAFAFYLRRRHHLRHGSLCHRHPFRPYLQACSFGIFRLHFYICDSTVAFGFLPLPVTLC